MTQLKARFVHTDQDSIDAFTTATPGTSVFLNGKYQGTYQPNDDALAAQFAQKS